MAEKPSYRRVLLKISGEALMGRREFGLDPDMLDQIARDVKEVHALGVELCLVIGGGNIFRGLSGAATGMDRATADYMGMLATVINSLAMQNALENLDVSTRVQSAIPMASVVMASKWWSRIVARSCARGGSQKHISLHCTSPEGVTMARCSESTISWPSGSWAAMEPSSSRRRSSVAVSVLNRAVTR